MGLFGKKKNTNDDIVKAFGGEEITVSTKTPTRKENKANQQKMYDIETQKGHLVDELRKVYAQISKTDHYDEADRITEIITTLRQGKVDDNARAVVAIDGFILKNVRELIVYCTQNNLYGISTAIDEIEKYTNQRGNVTYTYFEDPKYISNKLELMKAKVNRENLITEINKKVDTFYKLKESAAGQSEGRRQQIMKQMQQIKNDKELLQKQVDALDVNIENLSVLVSQKEQNAVTYVSDQVVDEFGNVLEETQIQDAKVSQMSKMAEKVTGANKTVRTQGMTVSDADSSTSTQSTADLDSMEI